MFYKHLLFLGAAECVVFYKHLLFLGAAEVVVFYKHLFFLGAAEHPQWITGCHSGVRVEELGSDEGGWGSQLPDIVCKAPLKNVQNTAYIKIGKGENLI